MVFSGALVRSLQTHRYHAAAALFFIIVGAVIYAPYISDLPGGIHAWAQSDRLALAINFYDYGLDFFTPRTSNLSSIGGITGVEFPLQAYLAALGGVIFGRDSINTLFRLLDVAVVLLGFYYLFRLIFERTGHFVAGLVPGAFLLASPVFAFYAGTTLPDPFSLSLSFIGYYYWLRFFDQRRFSDLQIAVLVLGLAALIKTTTLMHLGAVLGITLIWGFTQPELMTSRQRLYFLGLAVAVVGVIAAFFFHLQHLNATYQSYMFLAQARPITDPQTLHDVLQNVRRIWLMEYATVVQYRIIGVCGLLLLVFLRRNLRQYLPITLLLLAAVAIGYLFVQLMGAQFGVHDYYTICPLFPPAVLVLLLALLNLGQYTGKLRYATTLGLAALVFFSLSHGYKRFQRRMSDDYPPFSPYSHVWMRGGAAELAQAKVPAAASVLVFNELSPNIPLVYFDRRGQIWQPQDVAAAKVDDFLNRMAADSLDYLIMSPTVYAQLALQHAAMAAELENVGQQPAMVFRRRNRLRSW